jgi:signal peptidase I
VLNGRVYVDGKQRDLLSQATRGPDEDGFRPPYGVTEPYRVPDGCYFILGDDRSNIFDSRCYEAIPRKSILGRVVGPG